MFTAYKGTLVADFGQGPEERQVIYHAAMGGDGGLVGFGTTREKKDECSRSRKDPERTFHDGIDFIVLQNCCNPRRYVRSGRSWEGTTCLPW